MFGWCNHVVALPYKGSVVIIWPTRQIVFRMTDEGDHCEPERDTATLNNGLTQVI